MLLGIAGAEVFSHTGEVFDGFGVALLFDEVGTEIQ